MEGSIRYHYRVTIPSLAELAREAISRHASRSSTMKAMVDCQVTPLLTSNLGLLDSVMYEQLKLQINHYDDYGYKPNSRGCAEIFGVYGKFIGLLWTNHKKELLELLKVPVKKFKALNVGKSATELEIASYLELKNYQSLLHKQRKEDELHVYVGKRNTSTKESGYKKFDASQHRVPLDLYLKQCPIGVEFDSWIPRGLRLQIITGKEVRRSAFALFAPQYDSCLLPRSGSKRDDDEDKRVVVPNNGIVGYNENFTFYNETFEMWMTYSIHKAIINYLNQFFVEACEKLAAEKGETEFCNKIFLDDGLKLHKKHCVKCLSSTFRYATLLSELDEVQQFSCHCGSGRFTSFVDSEDMTSFRVVVSYVRDLLAERGKIDLSVLEQSSSAITATALPVVAARDQPYSGPTAEQLAEAEKFRKAEAEKVRLQREKKRKEEEKKRLEEQKASAAKNKKKK